MKLLQRMVDVHHDLLGVVPKKEQKSRTFHNNRLSKQKQKHRNCRECKENKKMNRIEQYTASMEDSCVLSRSLDTISLGSSLRTKSLAAHSQRSYSSRRSNKSRGTLNSQSRKLLVSKLLSHNRSKGEVGSFFESSDAQSLSRSLNSSAHSQRSYGRRSSETSVTLRRQRRMKRMGNIAIAGVVGLIYMIFTFHHRNPDADEFFFIGVGEQVASEPMGYMGLIHTTCIFLSLMFYQLMFDNFMQFLQKRDFMLDENLLSESQRTFALNPDAYTSYGLSESQRSYALYSVAEDESLK